MENYFWHIVILMNSALGLFVAISNLAFWNATAGFSRFDRCSFMVRLYGALSFPVTFPLLHVFGKRKIRCANKTIELIPLFWVKDDRLEWLYILLGTLFGILPKMLWNILGLWTNVLILKERRNKWTRIGALHS